MLRTLPDRYLTREYTKNDLALKDDLENRFSELRDYFLTNKPFQDPRLMAEMLELIQMIDFEVRSFGGLVHRKKTKDFDKYDGRYAMNKTKCNISSINQKIQEMESLFRKAALPER